MLTGKARVAGVVGWPIAHSRSPRLHGYWLRKYEIDGAYIPFAVPPDRLAQALRALPALGIRGVNVTVPHKLAALDICDSVDDLADRVGAVNTIVVAPDGTLNGSNTDLYGFLENLRRGSAWQPADGPVAVLGAGGAARAVCVGLLDAGVTELRIVNRTLGRAETLAAELGTACQAFAWNDTAAALDGAALLVNTTSLGMSGQPPLDLPLDALPRTAVVNDIVYTPRETGLLATARARGNPVVDGLGMLLHQACPGFEAWFGVRPRVDGDLREFVLRDAAAR